ncbi:MAG: DUF3422 family protein, partial [Rhizobium sp.]
LVCRFGPSKACVFIVTQRVASLSEQPIPDDILGSFLERRRIPTMSTCEPVEERQERKAEELPIR